MTEPVDRPWWYRRRRRLIAAGIAAVLLWLFIGGSDGLYAHLRMRTRISELRESNALLKQQNADLRLQIDRLTNDLDYIERVARERYGMARPGEQVYRVIPPTGNKKP